MSESFRSSKDPDVNIMWFREVFEHEEAGTSGMTGTFDKRWACVAVHTPTGICAVSWEERSRMKNKQLALEMLTLKIRGVA